jgi:hypothetical protein
MAKKAKHPPAWIECDGRNLFVVYDGLRIAKRENRQWISLEPGFVVTSPPDHESITITYHGELARRQ